MPSGWAQSGDVQPRATALPVYDQIVTTARKREETAQSVPGTIAVLPQMLLQRLGIQDMDELDAVAPNLYVAPDNVSTRTSRITLRSQIQNDTLITVDPAVGLYLDGVYVARSAGGLLNLLDVERVEVLNGPQGTLYGRNTTGGAIGIIANKPGPDFEGFVDVTLGTYTNKPGSSNGIRHDYAGMINAPLSDKSAVRLVFQSTNRGGFGENTLLDRDLQDENSLFWRASFSLEASDRLSFLLVHDGMRARAGELLSQVSEIIPAGLNPLCNPFDPNPVNAGACAANLFLTGGQWGSAALDGDPRRNQQNVLQLTGEPGEIESDVYGVSLTTTLELDSVTIKNITAWRELDQFSSFDFDGTQFDIGEAVQTDEQEQFSSEMQLYGGGPDAMIDWIIGAIYFYEDGRTDNVARVLSFLNPTNPFETTGKGINESVGLFGQASVKLSDVFSVVGGLRYTWEKRELIADSRDALVGCLVPPELNIDLATGGCRGAFSETFSKVTWEAGLNAQLDDNTLLFFKVSTGFKSGGFNLRASSVQAFEPFRPENILNFELGVKTTFMDGRGRANLTLFYADYKDIQRTDFIIESGNLSTVITNAASADVYGGELEIDVLATDNLQFRGTLGVSIARYNEFFFAGADFSDRRFPLSPDYSFSIAMIYQLPVDWLSSDWTFTSAFNYRGKAYLDIANTESLMQNGYGLLDLRLDIELQKSPVVISLFAKNVTNKTYKVSGTTFLDQVGFAFNHYGQPRQIGLQARLNW
ncbi:MAG: TonB-dependent receptor [Alphaproteobacteria bacterium]